jgi:hypothetical protein
MLEKPHTAATRYLTLYAASDVSDAAIRDPNTVQMVLRREFMWDAFQLNGCQSCYHFQTGSFSTPISKR